MTAPIVPPMARAVRAELVASSSLTAFRLPLCFFHSSSPPGNAFISLALMFSTISRACCAASPPDNTAPSVVPDARLTPAVAFAACSAVIFNARVAMPRVASPIPPDTSIVGSMLPTSSDTCPTLMFLTAIPISPSVLPSHVLSGSLYSFWVSKAICFCTSFSTADCPSRRSFIMSSKYLELSCGVPAIVSATVPIIAGTDTAPAATPLATSSTASPHVLDGLTGALFISRNCASTSISSSRLSLGKVSFHAINAFLAPSIYSLYNRLCSEYGRLSYPSIWILSSSHDGKLGGAAMVFFFA